jgi:hypothetical protein
MLLCKVMLNLVRFLLFISFLSIFLQTDSFNFQPEDVNSLLTIKLALKYVNLRDVESMRAIARAHQNRNLADFEKALKDYQHGTLSCVFTRPLKKSQTPWLCRARLRRYHSVSSQCPV